jgi:hypothetical protein
VLLLDGEVLERRQWRRADLRRFRERGGVLWGANTADAVSSAAICATAAATMYADTSMPAASACALIALWIAGSVEIENRVFAMPKL